MPAKQTIHKITRVSVAAGLLLTELMPTVNAQTVEVPISSGDDATPIATDSSRDQLPNLAETSSNAAQLAQPERISEIKTSPSIVALAEPTIATSSTSTPVASAAIAPPESLAAIVPAPPVAQSSTSVQIRPSSPVAQPERLAPVESIAVKAPSPQSKAPQSNTKIAIAALSAKLPAVSTQAKDLLPLPAPLAPPATTAASGSPSSISPSSISPSSNRTVSASPVSSAATAATAIAATPAPTTPTPTILPRAGASFTGGSGIGFTDSFGSLSGFVPLAQQPGRNITFLEGRVNLSTDNGNPSTNLLVGHRIYDQKSDRIYGGYLAYDHRSTGSNGFNQIGLGLETLGETWDVRANAYLPVGKTRQLGSESINNSTVTAFSDPFFQGNNLAINRTIEQQIYQRYEAAGTGFDLEAGGRIAKLGKSGDLRGYGGMYYFGVPGGDSILGWKARLEASPTENLRLGLGVSGDRTFGTSVAVTLGVTLPSSRPSRDELKQPLLARLGESVARNTNIVVADQIESRSQTIQDTRLITNPATGQPWQFRHANLGVGSGNGTFENPTGTVAAALAVAQPNDIVYVQPGTNPGIPAFTIPNDVQVLSTGPIQRINTLELGNLQLPLSGAGTLPNVLGTVTMGNRSTLSGFAISTTSGAGIVGNNISQITVRDNAIANTAAEGIRLTNVQGAVAITDNTIRQATLDGTALDNNQGQVDLTIARNQILNNGTGTANGNGVNVNLRNGATGTGTIIDNTITGNRQNGIALSLENSAQGTFNLSRNTISNNKLNGVGLLLSNDASGQFNLDSSTIANNQFKGLSAVFSDRSNGTLNLTNSTVTGNQDDGFYLQTSNQAKATATLLNNALTNNAAYGIFTEANGTSQLRILAGSNTITGNSISGVAINTNDTANTAAALRSNTITGNTLSDVEVFNNTPGTNACLQPLTNTIGNMFVDDSFGGVIAIESGALPTNTITNLDTTFWSNTTVPAGACGF
jgi:Right handed beta helix region/Inverse autotransporter, beta-domain